MMVRLTSLVALCGLSLAHAQTVPGWVVQTYAGVTDPIRICFDASGGLICGRDASGSGGSNGEAVKVHRIAPGGQVVQEIGTSAFPDPDTVAADKNGTYVLNGVLASGVFSGTNGFLGGIRPDQSTYFVLPSGTALNNATDMDWDLSNRLLVADVGKNAVIRFTGTTPTTLISGLTGVAFLDVAPNGDMYTTSATGVMRIHNSNGVVINSNFSTFPSATSTPFSLGPGNAGFPQTAYAINNTVLYSVGSNGARTNIGSAFATNVQDLIFGPDGAMYVSDFAADRILRITPPGVTTVSGTLTLSDFDAVLGDFPSAITVEIRNASTLEILDTQVVNPNVSGAFSFTLPASGAYSISARAGTWIRRSVLADARFGNVTGLDLTLLNGDCDGSDSVGTDDYLILNKAFDTAAGDEAFDARADLNGDGTVGTDDYLILNKNFDISGDE